MLCSRCHVVYVHKASVNSGGCVISRSVIASLCPCMSRYSILLTIRGEGVLLFHIFTFIPEKPSQLPAFTNFHNIHVQNLPKNSRLQSNPQKRKTFPRTTNNKQYTVSDSSYT